MVIGIENVDVFVNFVVKVKNQQKNQQQGKNMIILKL
jgi:hypothetical protein